MILALKLANEKTCALVTIRNKLRTRATAVISGRVLYFSEKYPERGVSYVDET